MLKTGLLLNVLWDYVAENAGYAEYGGTNVTFSNEKQTQYTPS